MSTKLTSNLESLQPIVYEAAPLGAEIVGPGSLSPLLILHERLLRYT